MRAVLPVNQLQIGEAQVKLIDQRRGLQSMAVTFPCLPCSASLPDAAPGKPEELASPEHLHRPAAMPEAVP